MKKFYQAIFILLILFYGGKTIAQAPPSCTTNLLPVNAAVNIDPYPSINLSWNPAAGATSYDVYVGTKSPPSLFIGNTTSDSISFIDASYSTKYYWYVVPKNANGDAIGCISTSTTSFTTMASPPPPTNDNCSGATTISATPISGTTLGATQSQPADICNGYTGTANDDVWYQFTPVSSGTVTITMSGNGSFDGVLEVFSGACGSLSSLACSDSSQAGGTEQISMTVTAGVSYSVRVYDFYSNLSNRGTFSISASGAPLPITLLYFRGQRQGDKNILQWSTATEQNNQGFEIQYSTDGNNFERLGFTNSKAVNGNSVSVLTYTFTDDRLLSGNAYYRLKQIDKDGKSSLSNIIDLKGDKINAIRISNIYPNPAKNKLNFTISAPVNDKVNIQISDVAGKEVIHQATVINSGYNRFSIDVSTLSSGSYFIKAIGSNGIQTSVGKFLKD